MRTWPLLSLNVEPEKRRENSELWPLGAAPSPWFWGNGLLPLLRTGILLVLSEMKVISLPYFYGKAIPLKSPFVTF